MRFRHTVSFGSDTKPVQTIRGEIDRDDEESALKSAARLAFRGRRRSSSFRSWVVVVERLEAEEQANVDTEATRFA